jgi:hypothetical protein
MPSSLASIRAGRGQGRNTRDHMAACGIFFYVRGAALHLLLPSRSFGSDPPPTLTSLAPRT